MKSLLTKIICVLAFLIVCIGICACTSKPNTTELENCDNGHNLVQSSYTAPTCKTNGEDVYKCSRCGFERKTTLLVVDHDYQVKSTTPSTCTTHGSKTFECSMCHAGRTDTLPLKDHIYTLVNETPSTCKVKGSKTYACNDCSDSYSTELELLSHDYQFVNTTPSTCIDHGSENYECSVCHDTYSNELPLIDHTFEPVTVLATCFTHGATKEQCSVCKEEQTIEETPLLTHDFGEDGYCEHCGIYKTLFDENALNVTWSASTILGTVRGNFVAKFKDENEVSKSYWQDHTVFIKITLFDKDENALNNYSFQSTTNSNGELIAHHINYVQANKFTFYFGDYDIFSADELKACKAFKIEISCEGYETIEKTYIIQ